ncbi:MarR family winged helix-turn-helix transcriptional regulator [Catenulispora pinisilvae]|uniref:MarR family winged helix-turn-helix transcriptional regulator n=1 Tax=Catenulispora pinisilvae TaxID=2705253 RepID=UPI00189139CC|nr:MarR family transcriptional regulator [Catenulispora pinisilvae]
MTRKDETTAPAATAPAATPPTPGTPTAMLSDLLWEVSAHVELLGESALADLPITTASSGMLMTVHAEPGITVADITRRMPKSQQAVSQIVTRLEKLGLIERRVRQGRGVALHLTAEGRKMAEAAFTRERATDEQLVAILGRERHDALRQVLVESRALLLQGKR